MFTKSKIKVTNDSFPNQDLKHSNDNLNLDSPDAYKNLRGHIVPGCSQMHIKSADTSENSISDDLVKKNSKWRTSKINSINEKNILMEKFESSLKERLLKSTSFTRQVPIFDSMSKERIRMKTPVLIKKKDNTNHESVYNNVFPMRKDLNIKENKELFSKQSKESQEWFKQLENEDQGMPTKHKQDEKQNKINDKIKLNRKDEEIKLTRNDSKSKSKKQQNEINKKDKKSKKKDSDDKEDVKSRKSTTSKKSGNQHEDKKRSKSATKKRDISEDGKNFKNKKIRDNIESKMDKIEFKTGFSTQRQMSHIFPQDEIKVMLVKTEKEDNNTIETIDQENDQVSSHKEVSQELLVEEECTDEEPCNEPKWFEEYGIDKKRRKLMIELSPEEEPSSSEESVQSDKDLKGDFELKQTDKKKIKRRSKKADSTQEQAKMFLRDLIDTPEETEVPKESICKAVREIKTIPLVTVEEIKEVEGKSEEVDVTKSVEIKGPKEMPTEYLQKYVGQYLIAGLAQVALIMPKDPVEYLAHWIIKERSKERLLEELKQLKSEVKAIRNNNLAEMRKKMQLDDLRKQMAQSYKDDMHDKQQQIFNSESETEKLLGETEEKINTTDINEEDPNKM